MVLKGGSPHRLVDLETEVLKLSADQSRESPATRDCVFQVTGSRDRVGFMKGKRLETLTCPSEERLGPGLKFAVPRFPWISIDPIDPHLFSNGKQI